MTYEQYLTTSREQGLNVRLLENLTKIRAAVWSAKQWEPPPDVRADYDTFLATLDRHMVAAQRRIDRIEKKLGEYRK